MFIKNIYYAQSADDSEYLVGSWNNKILISALPHMYALGAPIDNITCADAKQDVTTMR